MHVDLGANTCIVNQKFMLHYLRSAQHSRGSCQIVGTLAKTRSFGDMTFKFDDLLTTLEDLTYMHDNSHLTIEGGVLTNIDCFKIAQHVMHK